VRPFSALATFIVAALVVVSFGFLRHDLGIQERSLLQSDDDQLALVLNQVFTGLGSSLTSLDQVMAATNDSPTLFQSESKSIVLNPGASAALTRTVAGQTTVLLAAGPSLTVGQALSGDLAQTVASAGPALSSTKVLSIGDKKFLGLTAGTVPGTAVLSLIPITPSKPSAGGPGPYSQLNFSLYASRTADPAQLIGGTFGLKPLPGVVVHSFTKVGNRQWLVEASAKHSLVGGASTATPWIILVAGLLIALMIGLTSEILSRRRAYAERIADERTVELTIAQAALVRRERLSAVGEMATVIGHELRNPLGAAINLLFLARNKLSGHDDPELNGYLDRLERETNRAASLCEDLTAYMREREAVLIPVDLATVVAEVLESTPPPEGIAVTLGNLGVDLHADRAQLTQMITNLVLNAYQAMPEGGSVHIESARVDGFVEIAVQDSGEGIDPGEADRLLEPFFTTKAVGTGLGLAIVKRFADAHNGTVSIENGSSGGARFSIRLPAKTDEAAP